MYSEDNIFYKIINRVIDTEIVYETKHCIAIRDIHPQASTHLLVLPKGTYTDYQHFVQEASPEEQCDLLQLIQRIVAEHDHRAGKIVCNLGSNIEIRHMHVHVMLALA